MLASWPQVVRLSANQNSWTLAPVYFFLSLLLCSLQGHLIGVAGWTLNKSREPHITVYLSGTWLPVFSTFISKHTCLVCVCMHDCVRKEDHLTGKLGRDKWCWSQHEKYMCCPGFTPFLRPFFHLRDAWWEDFYSLSSHACQFMYNVLALWIKYIIRGGH